MRDDRNEGGFQFLCLAEAGDVAQGGDDVEQDAIRNQRGIGDAHRQGWERIAAFQVTFDIQVGMGSQRPAAGNGFFQGDVAGWFRPADDMIVRLAGQCLAAEV